MKIAHNLKDVKEAHANEQQAFETLENYGRSPYVIPCIYRSVKDDVIIWLYGSVAELVQVFRDLGDGTEWYRFESETEEWLRDRRSECEKLVRAGELVHLLGEVGLPL
jgi:hypothetical protein